MAIVRLPSQLMKYARGHRRVAVDAGTAGAALGAAASAHPDLGIRLFGDDGMVHSHLIVFVGDTEVGRSDLAGHPVGADEEISVVIGISGGVEDVRMRGFRDRVTVEAALSAALEGVDPLPAEAVGLQEAYGRVLAEDVVSGYDVPGFRRSTMDGYAVRAADTFGASAYNPIALELAGTSLPGMDERAILIGGTTRRIMTGSPVPEGADAVVRAEDAREDGDVVDVMAPVAEGKNVGRIGEDVVAGAIVLTRGRRLLAQDAGMLASIGQVPVPVHRRPLVRIIVSGDELVAPGGTPGGHRIVDSNSPMLAALVGRDGGVVEILRLEDDETAMREALGLGGVDVIVTAGAASVGTEDRVPLLVAELGALSVHGVAMRPSSPTGVGRIGGIPVLVLPGNPVSCLVAYDFFAGPVIRRLGGLPAPWPYRSIRATLQTRLVSQIGRTDYARVEIDGGLVRPLAISGASMLSSVTRADGFVVVPAGLEGYAEGTEIEVHLYDSWSAA